MAVENIKYFTFKLNSLQFETIRNLFIHYDWDFDECIVGEKKSFDSVSNIDQQLENGHQSVHEMPSTSIPQLRNGDGHDDNNDGNGDDGGDDSDDENDDGSDAESGCRFCFLSPCIITHRQLWLPDQPAQPHARNSELRKQKYKKFWKIMDLNGGWKHQKYIRKKRRLLGLDDTNTVWVGIGAIREVMPHCILDLVRGIYPNPPEQPYMGHKWW